MRRAILLVALLAAGCDDDSLPAKLANAQLHGAVAAQVTCAAPIVKSCNPVWTLQVQCTKFADGSAMVSTGEDVGLRTQVFDRANARAEDCSFAWLPAPPGTAVDTVQITGGELVYSSEYAGCGGAPPAPSVVALEEPDCTGFNLEAFGVE